jgi:hypothetical protein
MPARLGGLLRRLTLLTARGLRSLARSLAEWAGMRKRLEIVIKNPGFEGTEHALGALTLDFREQQSLEAASLALARGLGAPRTSLSGIVIVQNEAGEQRGFNPEYYVSHHVADAEEWERPNWMLPGEGEAAPGGGV